MELIQETFTGTQMELDTLKLIQSQWKTVRELAYSKTTSAIIGKMTVDIFNETIELKATAFVCNKSLKV